MSLYQSKFVNVREFSVDGYSEVSQIHTSFFLEIRISKRAIRMLVFYHVIYFNVAFREY